MDEEIREELGIIKDIHIGVRDTNNPCLFFNVELLDGITLQILPLAEAFRIIKETHCYKLEDLNNKPCIVQVERNSIRFLKMK